MNYALKFPGRTRQKTFLFSFIFILLFCPLFPPSGVQASESLISSVASPDVVGSAASEEENIDSFDVHPLNRWAVTNVGFTATVSEGFLNASDTGDGSADSYKLERGLRDLDGKVEVRFKIDTNDTANNFQDSMIIGLQGGLSSSSHFWLWNYGIRNNDFASTTELRFKDSTGATFIKTVSSNERIFDDLWYLFRLDYDLLQSSLRARLFFDNGSKVFDYSDFDILTVDQRPQLFADTTVSLDIRASCFSSSKYVEVLFDYINAPFKEREWELKNVPNANIFAHAWFGATAEDNVDSFAQYELTVPRFDVVGGTLRVNIDNTSVMVGGEEVTATFSILAVDADDGDLHSAVVVSLRLGEQIAPTTALSVVCTVLIDGVQEFGTHVGLNYGDVPVVDFSFGTSEDRSRIAGGIKFIPDSINSPDTYFDQVFSDDISNIATDPSQEFLLRVVHAFDFDADALFFSYADDLKIIARDRWGDLSPFLGDNRIPVRGPPNILTDIIDLIGLMITRLGEGLVAGFDFIIAPFQGLITDFQSAVSGFFDAIGLLVTGIIDDFIDGMNNLLDAVITQLGILAEDAAGLLFAIIDFLIVLVLDIVGEIWAVVEGTIFFIWNALNLPDVIEIFNLLLAYIVELVQWLVVTIQDVIQLYADLSWLIVVGWFFWAVPIQWARAQFDPLGGLGNFVEVYFYDLIPWTVFGIHLYVPQGIVFTLWLLLLLPADFAIFGAMDL